MVEVAAVAPREPDELPGVSGRWQRRLRGRPVLADGLLALGLFGLLLGWWAVTPRQFWDTPLPLVAALGAGELAFVVIRRRWLWVAAIGVAAYEVVAQLAIPSEAGGGGLGLLVIAYTTAAYLPLRPAIVAALVLWLPTILLSTRPEQRPVTLMEVPWWFLVTYTALLAVSAFFVGRVMRSRRAITAVLAERAATAEANQRALTAQAVADERRRIARELHDVVAHHVAVMGVLATGARRAASRDPAIGGSGGHGWQTIDETLATVETTGRTALRELRRMLDVLRSDSEAARDSAAATGSDAARATETARATEAARDSEAARDCDAARASDAGGASGTAGELAPQPGVASIETLVEQVRETGVPVRLQIEGETAALDAGVSLTVYRVVQEALTNVLKHAGPATAEVRIAPARTATGERWLHVEIFDTGRGVAPGAEPAGHGLVSMRERVHLLGGTLRAGPRPGGGFRVYAKIPAEPADVPMTTMRAP